MQKIFQNVSCFYAKISKSDIFLRKNVDLQLQQKGCGRGRCRTYLIIIHDHHIWWPYMMIIYDDHIWWSYMMTIYDDRIWWSKMIIIYDRHIWSSYVIIIYDHPLWSSYMTIIYDHRIWSSCMIIIYDHHIWPSWWSCKMIIWQRLFCPLPKNPTFIKLPGNFYKMRFVGTVALFSLWTKSFRGDQNLDPSWQFFGFIRTCQNPIGRASTKNWKLWLFHIKWRVGKKVTNYVFLFYKDLSSSY